MSMSLYIVNAINRPRNEFLTQSNSPFEKIKYYSVKMDIDTYDGISFIDNISLEIPYTGIEFKKNVQEVRKISTRIGVYAMQTENGIFEMVTGKKLTIAGETNSMPCIGISELDEKSYETIGRGLVILRDNPEVKKQYIARLNGLSENAKKINEAYLEFLSQQQREKEEAIQYLKTYQLPGNN